MFVGFHIGMSFSPCALSLAVTTGGGRGGVLRLPVPKGGIDVLSGRIVDREALHSVLRRLPSFDQRRMRLASVSLAIPSAAAYVHTWRESDRPRVYSRGELEQRVGALFPGKLEQLVFDIHQCWLAEQNATRVMLVVANREVVGDYVSLLETRRRVLVRTTTAEIARYNECCRLHPEIARVPAVVVSPSEEYVEVTGWSDGVMCYSHRAAVEGQSFTSPGGACEKYRPGPDGQRSSIYAPTLDSALLKVLSRFDSAERAACRVIICQGSAAALAEQRVHTLGYNPLVLRYCEAINNPAMCSPEIQKLLGDTVRNVCDGMEDALGSLQSSESYQPGAAPSARGGLGVLSFLTRSGPNRNAGPAINMNSVSSW